MEREVISKHLRLGGALGHEASHVIVTTSASRIFTCQNSHKICLPLGSGFRHGGTGRSQDHRFPRNPMGRINVVIVTRDIHCFGSKLGFDGCPESGPVQAGITVEDVPLHHPGIDMTRSQLRDVLDAQQL